MKDNNEIRNGKYRKIARILLIVGIVLLLTGIGLLVFCICTERMRLFPLPRFLMFFGSSFLRFGIIGPRGRFSASISMLITGGRRLQTPPRNTTKMLRKGFGKDGRKKRKLARNAENRILRMPNSVMLAALKFQKRLSVPIARAKMQKILSSATTAEREFNRVCYLSIKQVS